MDDWVFVGGLEQNFRFLNDTSGGGLFFPRLVGKLLEELGKRAMIDFVVIKILITLLPANGLKAEHFELINVSSLSKIVENVVNTYVLPELLMSAVGTHELREDAAVEGLSTLNVKSVALARPSHAIGVLFALK